MNTGYVMTTTYVCGSCGESFEATTMDAHRCNLQPLIARISALEKTVEAMQPFEFKNGDVQISVELEPGARLRVLEEGLSEIYYRWSVHGRPNGDVKKICEEIGQLLRSGK